MTRETRQAIQILDAVVRRCAAVERGQTTLEDLRNDIGRVAECLRDALKATPQRRTER